MSTVSPVQKLKNFLIARGTAGRRGWYFLSTILLALVPTVAANAAGGLVGGILSAVGAAFGGLIQGAVGAVLPILVWWFLFSQLAGMFAEIMAKLFIFCANFLVVISQYNSFLGSTLVTIGWAVTRDLANLFLVVALIIIAFATILNIQKYQAQALMKNFLFAALLVNFSRTICGLMIDASQVVMSTFVSGYSETAAGNMVKLFHVGDWMKLAVAPVAQTTAVAGGNAGINESSIAGFVSNLLSSLAGFIFTFFVALAAALAVFSLVVVLVQRIITLWMLIIVSPLAFVAQVLPYTATYANKWWDAFIKQLIVGPAVAFIVWVSLASTASSQNAFDVVGSSYQGSQGKAFAEAGASITVTAVSSWENLAMFIVPVVLFIFGAKWAVQFSGGVAGSITKAVSSKAQGYLKSGLKAFQKQAITGGKQGGKFSIGTQFGKGWRGEKTAAATLLGGAQKLTAGIPIAGANARMASMGRKATSLRSESEGLRKDAEAAHGRGDTKEATRLEQEAFKKQNQAAAMDERAAAIKSGSILTQFGMPTLGKRLGISGINRAKLRAKRKYLGEEAFGGVFNDKQTEAEEATAMSDYQKSKGVSEARSLSAKADKLAAKGDMAGSDELRRQAKAVMERGESRAGAADKEASGKFQDVAKSRGLASPEGIIDETRRRALGGENITTTESKALYGLAEQQSREVAEKKAKERNEHETDPKRRSEIEIEERDKAFAWKASWPGGDSGELPLGARRTTSDVIKSEAALRAHAEGVGARDVASIKTNRQGAAEAAQLLNLPSGNIGERDKLVNQVVSSFNQHMVRNAGGSIVKTPASAAAIEKIALEIYSRNPNDFAFIDQISKQTGADSNDFKHIIDAINKATDPGLIASYSSGAEMHRNKNNRSEFEAIDFGMTGDGAQAQFTDSIQRVTFTAAVEEDPAMIASIDPSLLGSDDVQSAVGAAIRDKDQLEVVRKALLENRELSANEVQKRMKLVDEAVIKFTKNDNVKREITGDPLHYDKYWPK